MKYKLILLSLFILSASVNSYSQQYSVQVVSNSKNETILKVSVNSFDWSNLKGTGGNSVCVSLKDGRTFHANEFIQLPELNYCLSREEKSSPVFTSEIISSVDFDAENIPALKKLEDKNLVTASRNIIAFPEQNVKLKNSFSDGDNTGFVFNIFPVQYLSGENKIRLCTEMLVKVNYSL